MIRKIAYLGAIALLISSIVSCEEEYTQVGTSVVNNSQFSGEQMSFDLTMATEDIPEVQADNINANINEYLLGVYKPDNYKKITASIISQLKYPGILETEQSSTNDVTDYGTSTNIDSTYTLNKVTLKLPYPDAKKQDDGTFNIDNVIGNTNTTTSLEVLQNKTYLNVLNPINISEKNIYLSNATYSQGVNLTDGGSFEFTPKGIEVSDIKKPFLTIPLDITKMRSLFWNKFGDIEFSTSDKFQDYFRGLIIKAKGTDGALIPFKFDATFGYPILEFHYTINIVENGTSKSPVENVYSFPLKGIKNSIYEVESAQNSVPANNVVIQGTAGSMAKIEISDSKLNEIRNKKALINDATLTFFVNNSIDKDTTLVPQKLLLYKELKKDGKKIPTHISDIYMEPTYYGGNLENTNGLPEKYKFHITDYIVDLINNKEENMPLLLKVFNTNSDLPISNSSLDTNVKSYNWNPRGVTLKGAKLEVFYSEKK